jgi:amino acid permease
VLLIYGFMFMALIASCIAVSLGELASAYPNSGTHLSPLPVPPGGGGAHRSFTGETVFVRIDCG